jgi:hypothetical protein
MKGLFLAVVMAVMATTVLSGSALAYGHPFTNVTGRNGATVNSATFATAGKYKTAVAFGTYTGAVTVQGSYDGNNWFDCRDETGNVITWGTCKSGIVIEWWDTFVKYRVTYKKCCIGNRPLTLHINWAY